MVIFSPGPLEVGKIIILPNLKDPHGVMQYGIPAMILREATKQEWQDYVEEMRGGPYPNAPNGDFFYEISVD